MTYDRKQYRDLATGSGERSETVRRSSNLPAQAAVQAALLMDDANWRAYQQMLQGAIVAMRDSRQKMLERLARPLDAVSMGIAQCEIASCDGAIAALESAIALPRQIVENAEKADQDLSAAVQSITGGSAHFGVNAEH